MSDNEKLYAIKRLLSNHASSPSLRHIRDPHTIHLVAHEIMRIVGDRSSVWCKWNEQREALAKSAVGCWIPIDDLRDFLNGLPGPPLTTTDVSQRMRAFEDEDYFACPSEELQPDCVAIFQREKAEGTELPAIIGLLREHVEREEERLRTEQKHRYEQWREKDLVDREQRLLSGADCNWTQLRKSAHWFCRTNGRTYRLSPAKDKMWTLARVKTVSDDEKGAVLGKYQRRGDATKVVAEAAYQPEPAL